MKPKFILLPLVTVLLVSLVGNIYVYSEHRQSTIRNVALKEIASELNTSATNLKDEIEELENQLNYLKEGPRLVTRLGTQDIRYDYEGQTIRFYISGEVWNVGTTIAYNSRLHVTLYQGSTITNDTYIEIGNINPGIHADVASDVFYTGSKLTNWTITPECN